MFKDGKKLSFNLELNHTDDPRITDRRDVTIQGLNILYIKPRNLELNIGNIYEELSRYTIMRSLTGISAFWRPVPGINERGVFFKIIAGEFQNQTGVKQNNQYTYGFRIGWDKLPAFFRNDNSFIGISFSNAKDNKDIFSSTDTLGLDSTVLSLDTVLPLFPGFILDAEIARSFAEQKTADNISHSKIGNLFHMGLKGNVLKKVFINGEMERIEPDSRSITGRYINDILRWNLSTAAKLFYDSLLDFHIQNTENNILRQLGVTNSIQVIGTDFSIPCLKHLFPQNTFLDNFRNMWLIAGLEKSFRLASDKSFENNSQNLNYKLLHQIYGFSYSIGYSFQENLDKLNLAQNTFYDNLITRLSRNFNLKKYDLKSIFTVSYNNSIYYDNKKTITNRNYSIGFNLYLKLKDLLVTMIDYSYNEKNPSVGLNGMIIHTISASFSYKLKKILPCEILLITKQNQISDDKPERSFLENETQLQLRFNY